MSSWQRIQYCGQLQQDGGYHQVARKARLPKNLSPSAVFSDEMDPCQLSVNCYEPAAERIS